MITSIIAIISFASCDRRDLTYGYYPYCDVVVNIDWSKAYAPKDEPQGVSVWFYPKDGGAPIKRQSNNVHEVKATIQHGIYDIVVFNMTPAEFASIGFRETEHLDQFQVYAVKEPQYKWYKVEEDKEEHVLHYPETFTLAVYRDFEVTDDMIEKTQQLRLMSQAQRRAAHLRSTIVVTPKRVTMNATIDIRVKGIQNLLDARAAITNMAEGYEINKERWNATPATHLITDFTKTGSTGEGMITMKYTTWGLQGDVNNPAYTPTNYDYWTGHLKLEVMLIDGKTVMPFEFELDHTIIEVIKKEDGEGSPIIELELHIDATFAGKEPPVVLPDVKPIPGGGGFSVDVEEWDSEIVDIPI